MFTSFINKFLKTEPITVEEEIPETTKPRIIDDNASDIRIQRFAFESLPVQKAVVAWNNHFPIEAAPQKIAESFIQYYDHPVKVNTFKAGSRTFYSTYAFHNSQREEHVERSDGYTSCDIRVYKAAISGKIMTGDGVFEMISEKDWKITGTSHDSEYDGMCGIYNPWYYYYKLNAEYRFQNRWKNLFVFDEEASTFRDYAIQQSLNGYEIEMREFWRNLGQKWAQVQQFDENFKYSYQTLNGESGYLAVLPIQQFDNEKTVMTAYSLHQIDNIRERNIHFLIPENELSNSIHENSGSDFIIKTIEKEGKSIYVVSIDGKEIKDFPAFTDLISLRQVASRIDEAKALVDFLDDYVLSDKDNRLLNRLKQLDRYTIENSQLVKKTLQTRALPSQKEASEKQEVHAKKIAQNTTKRIPNNSDRIYE